MMLRDAVSTRTCDPRDKSTGNVKTRDRAKLWYMRSKQTKDSTMAKGVIVK